MKGSVVAITFNGVERETLRAPGTTLLNLLREHQSLTGTRRGCDQGACGSCTVLVDGKPSWLPASRRNHRRIARRNR